MERRKLVIRGALTVGFLVLFVSHIVAQPKGDKKAKRNPNIILIVTDDQGYGDVGFNGCKDIPTPHIDQIANQGVRFTQGYVSYAVCAPSRAGLLTGRYQDRFGYSRNPLYRPEDSTIGLPLSEQMLPELVQQVGYRTMAIGKWHLGAHEKYRPNRRGFDEFFGFLGGGHRYFPEEFSIRNSDSAKNEGQSYRTKLLRNSSVTEESEYLTDALSREAISFIRREADHPFFLYLAYNAPHTPLQAPSKYLDRFSFITGAKRKTYAAMVSAVDDGVGRILELLDELKLAENTIIFFLSDNGGPENDNGSDNGPLRGGKGSLFEGGIRVPFAIRWPGRIPAGSVYENPVISLDIFATIAANLNHGITPRNPLDGVNLLPFLQGQKSGFPHDFLFWRQFDRKDYAVVHQSGQKLLTLKDSATHVFDLRSDIGETTNRVTGEPEITSRFREKLESWLKATVPPLFYGLNQEEKYEEDRKRREN